MWLLSQFSLDLIIFKSCAYIVCLKFSLYVRIVPFSPHQREKISHCTSALESSAHRSKCKRLTEQQGSSQQRLRGLWSSTSVSYNLLMPMSFPWQLWGSEVKEKLGMAKASPPRTSEKHGFLSYPPIVRPPSAKAPGAACLHLTSTPQASQALYRHKEPVRRLLKKRASCPVTTARQKCTFYGTVLWAIGVDLDRRKSHARRQHC